MQEPKVSIIVPCYNAEKTIKATIDSIKRQLFKDFEVIFVNDGSTDNTLNILNQYLSESKLKYRILSQEDKGVSVARNTGIKASNGKYIMFLDADDVYHPAIVLYLVVLIESTRTDTVFCSFTRDICNRNSSFDTVGKTTLLDNYKLQEYLLFKYIPCGMWSYIYKKDIIEKFNILFTPGLTMSEDREFTWKYLCHCNSGLALDLPLYGYNDNPESVVNRTISLKKLDTLETMNSVDSYLKANNSSFYPVFHEFGYSRTLWSILKTFAKANNKELFNSCMPKKEAKKHMQRLLRYPDNKIKISSLLYVISPNLFFKCVQKFYRMDV